MSTPEEEKDGLPEVPEWEGAGKVKVDPHPTYTGPYVSRPGGTCHGPGHSQDIVREENEELAGRDGATRDPTVQLAIDVASLLKEGLNSPAVVAAGKMDDGLSADGVAYVDPLKERDLAEADAERAAEERAAISHNSYFEGAVQSLGHIDAEGRKVTNGTMKVGSYKFSTSAELAEEILVQDGELHIVMREGELPVVLKAGMSFNVPAGTAFTAIAITPVEYRCVYRPVKAVE